MQRFSFFYAFLLAVSCVLFQPDTTHANTPPLTIENVSINPDGWTANLTITEAGAGGTFSNLNNKSNPGLLFSIQSPSYDAAGATTTLARTVYATAIKRKPFPNQTSREEITTSTSTSVTVTLSEYVYATDQVLTASAMAGFFANNGAEGSSATSTEQTISVQNNSTQLHPLPQATWLTPDLSKATSTSFAPKLAVMHRFGRNGQPVRAVEFIATDVQGTVVRAIASTLSTEQYSASQNTANFFSAPLNFGQLAAGDLVTIDAVIYPWVGESFKISQNGAAYPSPNLTVIKVLNDRNNSYGTAYAYVNGTGSTVPTVSTNPLTAAAAPYATIAAAASAIQSFNASNFGRTNVGGGIIRIAASTTIVGLGTDTMDTILTDGKIPLEIQGVDKNTSVYMNAATSINNDIPGLLKLSNLTFRKNGASITAFDGKNNINNVLVFEDVHFDANNQATFAGWLIQFGRGYFINSSGSYLRQGDIFSSNIQGTVLVLGSTFYAPTAYNVIASRGNQSLGSGGTRPLGVAKGSLFAWNFASVSSASSYTGFGGNGNLGPQGIAFVGNILEQYHPAPVQSNLHISADGNVTPNVNMIDYANTVVGQRSNMFYQDAGTATVEKNGLTKHSVHWKRNTKSDVFKSNGNLVGNWAIRYGVGSGYSLVSTGESSGKTTPSPSSWLGEIAAVGEIFSGNPDFMSDRSSEGTETGSGDYRPGNLSQIPFIPEGETYFAKDLLGQTIPQDGTARAGAVQMQ